MELYNEDCFEAFKKVKDKSVNLFLLDLPYGQTSCKWDSVIDLEKMWKEIKRTMVKDGIIVFFTTTKFGFTLIQSNPTYFSYDLVWKKSRKVGFLNANKMPLRQHEMVYVFKEKGGTYNPQKTKGEPYDPRRKKETFCSSIYRDGDKTFEFKPVKNDGYRHPTSIVENTILEYKNASKTVHKTQKPVDLCEWLIKTYSNEEDTVMDFCMGSGTTGVACKNTNRKFIGVEKDENIFKIAKGRIENINNLF